MARAGPGAEKEGEVPAGFDQRMLPGDPGSSPQTESYWGRVNPVDRGAYTTGETLCGATTMAYHRHHHADTHIVRIFNTYGPRMRLNDGGRCRILCIRP